MLVGLQKIITLPPTYQHNNCTQTHEGIVLVLRAALHLLVVQYPVDGVRRPARRDVVHVDGRLRDGGEGGAGEVRTLLRVDDAKRDEGRDDPGEEEGRGMLHIVLMVLDGCFAVLIFACYAGVMLNKEI